MKIEKKDWMDWLHKVRATSMEKRKREKLTLAQYLKSVEGKERPPMEKIDRRLKKGKP